MNMLALAAMGLCVFAADRAEPAVYDSSADDDTSGQSGLWPHESYLCGPIALYLACRSFGITRYSVQDLAVMASFSDQGTSIEGLRAASHDAGLSAVAVRTDAESLETLLARDRSVRAIVLLKSAHFCYIDQARQGKFRVSRYPFQPKWVRGQELGNAWGGQALLVSPKPFPAAALEGRAGMGTIAFAGAAVLLLSAGAAWVAYALIRARTKRRAAAV